MTKEREALKQALVLIESSVLHCDAELNENDVADITKQVREALAQPEQEPEPQPASEEDMKVYRAIAANYHQELSMTTETK